MVRPATSTIAPAVRPHTAAAALLSRRATVYLPAAGADTRSDGAGRLAARLARRGQPAEVVVAAGVILLEADLLERGFLVSAGLRDHLSRMEIESLRLQGTALLADIDLALGGARPMVPLFRGFPRSVPRNTAALYVDRVLTFLFQQPEQPCVLCGTVGSVNAVSPCAHLVCSRCFDGADYSACPICHRRIDLDDPFLRPSVRSGLGRRLSLPMRARVITLGRDASADAHDEVAGLLARTGALSQTDAADLGALLQLHDRRDPTWLPPRIPARETQALVLAWLLDDRQAWPVTLPVVVDRIATATDALRLLAVRAGGDAGLASVPGFGPVPRPVRRALLHALDRLDPRTVAEDLGRHRRLWIHAAERLHPFEYASRFPNAASAFAVLRGTPLTDDALSALLRRTAEGRGLATSTTRATGVSRLTSISFAGLVERRLAAGDAAGAVGLLSNRPGEFLRRLDHVLRLAAWAPAGRDAADLALTALADAATRAAPAVLISTLGQVRTRTAQAAVRVYFPKGGSAKTHVAEDARPPLPNDLVERVRAILTTELLERCGRLTAVDVAVVDEALHGLIAPFTQRTASRALLTVPRGSALTVPAGRYLRLFLHWLEGPRRVDLDLSGAFFDESWDHVGTCDYTSLRWHAAAVHSGDLTSAPPPLGATEFVDIDLDRCRAAGARYVVMAVLSYNNVPFVDLPEAYAGVMVRDDEPEENAIFEPRSVEQRFDLTGQAKLCVPFVLDLQTRTLRWLDVMQGVTGTHHAVHRHANALATLGAALTELYASEARVRLGELAVWHAAARAQAVLVRRADGTVVRHDRRAGETSTTFAARIIARGDGQPTTVGAGAPPGLAFLLRGDIQLRAGAEVYALYAGGLVAGEVRLLAADDLAAQLAPAAPELTSTPAARA